MRSLSHVRGLLVLALAVGVLPACGRRAEQSSRENNNQNQSTAQQQQPAPPEAEQPAPPAPQPPATQAAPPARRESGETGRAIERPRPAPRETSGTGAPAESNVEQRQLAPPPAPVVRTVSAGTVLGLRFLDGVSSQTSHPGDGFRATVTQDVVQDGVVLIPAGSTVIGTVREAVPVKKIGGQARLGLDFSQLDLPSGQRATIHASFAEAGKNETGKDAATIGGAAAGGAVLGRVLSKNQANRNTVLGALIGAGVGTAIAAHTKGQDVAIPSGSVIEIKLDQPAQVTITPH